MIGVNKTGDGAMAVSIYRTEMIGNPHPAFLEARHIKSTICGRKFIDILIDLIRTGKIHTDSIGGKCMFITPTEDTVDDAFWLEIKETDTGYAFEIGEPGA